MVRSTDNRCPYWAELLADFLFEELFQEDEEDMIASSFICMHQFVQKFLGVQKYLL